MSSPREHSLIESMIALIFFIIKVSVQPLERSSLTTQYEASLAQDKALMSAKTINHGENKEL